MSHWTWETIRATHWKMFSNSEYQSTHYSSCYDDKRSRPIEKIVVIWWQSADFSSRFWRVGRGPRDMVKYLDFQMFFGPRFSPPGLTGPNKAKIPLDFSAFLPPILPIEQVFETERTEMIDKTCTPANRETVVLVFLWIVKRIMTTSHVKLRDDVFREKKCSVTVNMSIIRYGTSVLKSYQNRSR